MCGAHSHTSLLSGTMYLTGGIFMELKKHITDEKTDISYTLCGDYFLDDFELRLIIRAPEECRNTLLAEGNPTENLDELLIRFCK